MRNTIVCFFVACLAMLNKAVAQDIRVVQATCQNKVNPKGVPLHELLFGWQLHSKKRNSGQSAYQLVIAGSSAALQQNSFDVFNSGIQQSSQSVAVSIKDLSLQPGKLYYWKVKLWDTNKRPLAWSAVQNFTTGLFKAEDWAGAQWIGYEEIDPALVLKPGVPDTAGLGKKALSRTVIPCFRKEFTLSRQPVQALAFVTGLGQYEFSVNGKKAGDAFLAPGWTYYDKRTLYNIYDITDLVRKGVNAAGLVAGNGFYNINRERYYKLNIAFGAPKMICKISIRYADGSHTDIVSNKDWTTAPSPTAYTSIYGGESYNANLEQNGWNKAGFNDHHWKQAMLVENPGGVLEPEIDYSLKVMDTIGVQQAKQLDDHSWLYDFGQNSSGIIRIAVKGHKGDTIKIIPAELVTRNGRANQNASGAPYYFSYILKGEGVETWQPSFSYYGFRYAQVETAASNARHGADLPSVVGIQSLHTRNSTPSTGHFSCSDSLFNRINTLIQWAIKSNMQSVITDCPHREKLGWMEQNYLMGNSIQYNYNIQLLYRKLVLDMMDAQRPNGLVPDIAPEYVVFSGGFEDSPEWGSAAVIIPWLLYQWYGDKNTMQQAYPMMQRYVAYLGTKAKEHILSHGLGDWYDFGPGFPGYAQLTPIPLTATAVYYYDVWLLAKMAGIMNDAAAQQRLSALALDIKTAFNRQFFNTASNLYATGSQTAMAMPLVTGLVEETHRKAVLQNLVDSIYKTGKALTAGDIGFHFLVKALDDGGASQLLYEMNNRNDIAGYGFQLTKGATALTESWNALEEVSNNHLMLGHIMEWLYSGLAGIGQEEESFGYKHIKIRPQPVGKINWASARFESPYGPIVSDWKKTAGKFSLHVVIPANTKASVYLPASAADKVYESGQVLTGTRTPAEGMVVTAISSGEYWFTVNLSRPAK
jgi:alpha-L-rhamnosidase